MSVTFAFLAAVIDAAGVPAMSALIGRGNPVEGRVSSTCPSTIPRIRCR
jgi:hypothetical protein